MRKKGEAKLLLQKLAQHFPDFKINFDQDDCYKILRVEGHNILPENSVDIVIANNYQCMVLE